MVFTVVSTHSRERTQAATGCYLLTLLVNGVLCLSPLGHYQIKSRDIRNRCNISTKTWDIGWVFSDGLASGKWTSHHSVKTHLAAIISHRATLILMSLILEMDCRSLQLQQCCCSVTDRRAPLDKIRAYYDLLPFWLFSHFHKIFCLSAQLEWSESSCGTKEWQQLCSSDSWTEENTQAAWHTLMAGYSANTWGETVSLAPDIFTQIDTDLIYSVCWWGNPSRLTIFPEEASVNARGAHACGHHGNGDWNEK